MALSKLGKLLQQSRIDDAPSAQEAFRSIHIMAEASEMKALRN
jgi:hypothetical protein